MFRVKQLTNTVGIIRKSPLMNDGIIHTKAIVPSHEDIRQQWIRKSGIER